MKNSLISVLVLLLYVGLFAACGRSSESKGDVRTETVATDTLNDLRVSDEAKDSSLLVTRPRTVLVTGLPQFRLTPIMKLNWGEDKRSTFYGSIEYRISWEEDVIGVNVWNSHVVPGYDAACGYNIVNLSHFDTQARTKRNIFENPVLVKTIYFPTIDHDTLNGQPVHRNSYMISVFDEDTNKDGFVNQNDLRRFYHFALPGLEKTPLVPSNESVLSGEYDPGTDFMYVFTRRDLNKNGFIDGADEWHVHWIDMKDPRNHGEMY